MNDKIQNALSTVRELNEHANGGRGVGVLRSVILSLERGDWEGACVSANTDADKMRQYPGVREKMEEIGLVETFDWSLLDD